MYLFAFFWGGEGLEMFLEGKMKKLVFFLKEVCVSLCLVFGWCYSEADRTPPRNARRALHLDGVR